MPAHLKRLLLLALALVLIGAPIAGAAADGGPVAAAAKKKGKKCKGKKKKKSTNTGTAFAAKKKKGKKCKKAAGGGGGLPGKPLKPDDPNDPDPEPLTLASVSLTENPILAGTSGSGQVNISGPAPTGGQPVTLSSGDPTRVGVPDSVHIAAGQSSATFPISTTAGPNDSIVITAAMASGIRTATLNLVEEESLKSLVLDYQCFPDDNLTNFGANVVTFDVRSPVNASVDLDSSDPFILDVPPTVTVPQGGLTGVFGVDTLQMTTTPVTVTATYDDDEFTDTATVRDNSSPLPVASSLGLSPNSVVVGDPSTGTVNLDCEAPPGGITVNLSSSNPAATVPAQVVVPEGALGATFTITTNAAATPGTAQISATATSGPPTVNATLTLRAIGT